MARTNCKHCTTPLNRARIHANLKICVECSKLAGQHIWHHCGTATANDNGDFGWRKATGQEGIQSSCPQSRWYKQAEVACFDCTGVETGTQLTGEALEKFLAKVEKARSRHLTPKQVIALEERLTVERSRGRFIRDRLEAGTIKLDHYYRGILVKNAKDVREIEETLRVPVAKQCWADSLPAGVEVGV